MANLIHQKGINLVAMVDEGEKIYGDGVNIEARMESLAEAEGICISGTVYEGFMPKGGRNDVQHQKEKRMSVP